MAHKHFAALQTFVRLIDCLIASTLREVTACEGKAIYSSSLGVVGEEREVKAEGRTQLDLPQHLLLQHGQFLPDPFACDSKSTHWRAGPHSSMSQRKSGCFYTGALFLIDLLPFPLGIRKQLQENFPDSKTTIPRLTSQLAKRLVQSPTLCN